MICRELGFLFIHVPKTAGQSIEQCFIQFLGLDRETSRSHLLMGRNEDRGCGTEKLAHLSALEYMECGHVTPEEFAGMFKFAFVRNPYERLVSEYLYRNYFSHRSFRDFVLNRMPAPGWDDQYRHVMPQYEMLHDGQGRLLVDFVGRFENLRADFSHVCERLGLAGVTLPHRNPSRKASRNRKRWLRNLVWMNGENTRRQWQEYYDGETRAAAARYYLRDFETFGYGFEEDRMGGIA